MPTTTTAAAVAITPALSQLIATVRESVRLELSPGGTASLVARRIAPLLTRPGLLPPSCREGDPDRYRQHLVHAEPDGSFSVVGLVWLPGQRTPVHDHVAWCVAGVCQGAETEQRFTLRGRGEDLRLVPLADRTVNRAGTAVGFAPPGDIHLVENAGPDTVLSLHVYGADISRLSTSVRRVYHCPVAGGETGGDTGQAADTAPERG